MTKEQFWAQYGAALNDKQRAAVEQVDGAVLLLAVPGSGKTTALVYRLGYMCLVRGIAPEHILTMTYTVAATEEMRARCAALFGEQMASQIRFGTINSVSLAILRYFSSVTGRIPPMLYPDERSVSGIVAGLLRAQGNYYPTEYDMHTARTAITYVKNQMLSHDQYRHVSAGDIDVEALMDGYEAAMLSAGWMDFDDQLVYAHRILQHYPDIQAHFAQTYHYLLVDEAQDSSKIQHAIIRLLVGNPPNLFMVGDEDQSIYGFRAAYPEALLRFGEDYPNATVLFLEQNYRSARGIVSLAQTFVGRNRYRRAKQMVSMRAEEGGVERVVLPVRAAQYDYLVQVAQKTDAPTAVLFRDNECALPLLQRLLREKVPYQDAGLNMSSFFEHRSVLTVCDIVEFAFFPRDRERFMRIYGRLGCRIKREDAEYACRQSAGSNTPPLHVLLRRYHNQYAKAAQLLDTIDALAAIAKAPTAEMALSIFTEHFCRKISWLSPNKQFILGALSEGTNVHPAAFRAHLNGLAERIAAHQNTSGQGIVLSTVHGAKGLEYDNVYLIDVVDGVICNRADQQEQMSNDDEEDRRLFYVAMTRAKNHLYVLCYRDSPSVFCAELFGKLVRAKTADASLQPWVDAHQVGDALVHRKYGRVTIVSVSAGEEDYTLTLLTPEGPKSFSLRVLLKNNLIQEA